MKLNEKRYHLRFENCPVITKEDLYQYMKPEALRVESDKLEQLALDPQTTEIKMIELLSTARRLIDLAEEKQKIYD